MAAYLSGPEAFTNEIGVRIALGRQRQLLLRLVLLDGMKPALMGSERVSKAA
jgi:hypothetical protein